MMFRGPRLAWNVALFLVPALVAPEIFPQILSGQRFSLAILAVLLGIAKSVMYREPENALMELASLINTDYVPKTVQDKLDLIKSLGQKWDKIRSHPDHVRHPLKTSPDPPRFEPDDPDMLVYLREHGYAVVASVADAKDIARAKDLLWEDILEPNGMLRADPGTWAKNFPGSASNGIISGSRHGQSPMLWFVRELPRVRQAFAAIWGTTELLVSFDGANVFRPWHRSPEAEQKEKTVGSWFHVDQGRKTRGFQCVQGLVSFYAATEATGGLTVIPGSHKQHDFIMSYTAYGDADFVQIRRNDILLDAPKRLVTCRPGDLLLWDSRCVHCNSPAITRPVTPPNELLRFVAYVCMCPRSAAPVSSDPSFFVKRFNAYRAETGTNHWPIKFMGKSNSEVDDDCLPELRRLSELRRNLIGLRIEDLS